MPRLYPVILSGGAGTRLWPLSRRLYPKQFQVFSGDQSGTLFVSTVSRLRGTDVAPPTILGSTEHRFLIREGLAAAQVTPRGVVLEPVGRNTAPAIAVAALQVANKDPDGILCVMPSDHLIHATDVFRRAVDAAAEVASRGALVLFAISPTLPHTGYGYVQRGEPITDGLPDSKFSAFHVRAFQEKPDLSTAQRYLASGDFGWNSGIYVLHTATLLEEYRRLAPEILEAARTALERSETDLEFLKLDRAAFEQAPRVSIDYAITEKSDKTAVIPANFDWSDVGSWSSLWDVSARDAEGNVVVGDAALHATRNSYIRSESGLVATVGVEDLVVIATRDAVLVAEKAHAQDVAQIVEHLRATGRPEVDRHHRDTRLWGYLECLSSGPAFRVNRLHIAVGAQIARQRHKLRSEHWLIASGQAAVTKGEEEFLLKQGESCDIPAGVWHQISNVSAAPLEVIEVQMGASIGEDDVERA